MNAWGATSHLSRRTGTWLSSSFMGTSTGPSVPSSAPASPATGSVRWLPSAPRSCGTIDDAIMADAAFPLVSGRFSAGIGLDDVIAAAAGNKLSRSSAAAARAGAGRGVDSELGLGSMGVGGVTRRSLSNEKSRIDVNSSADWSCGPAVCPCAGRASWSSSGGGGG
jgi:hypothetical protein